MVVRETTNILIVGVGGQGSRAIMNILACAALEAEQEVRVLASTSLGRLGGPIVCHVRIGRAASGTIPAGEADVLLALEMNEALRAFPMMRLGSLALMHPYRRFPVSTGNSDMRYPTANEIEMISRAKGIKSVFVPKGLFSVGECMAGQDHYTIPANILMLGILCGCKELFARSLIEQALRENFPNHEEQNRQALGVGWRYGEELKACV